jgi:putative transposase
MPEVADLIRQHVRLYTNDNRRPTAAGVWRLLKGEIDDLNKARLSEGLPPLTVPSQNAVHRKIRSEDLFHLLAGREGADVAARKHSIVHGGVYAMRPLERVEMDEWKCTVHTLIVGTPFWDSLSDEDRAKAETSRCWVTYAICVATRCIVGLHVSLNAPSSASSLACLRLILRDKTPFARAAGCQATWHMHGSMEQLPTDGGAAFQSKYREAVQALFSEHVVGPPGTPMFRGTVESAFRTTDLSLMQYFSGRTFANVTAKGSYKADTLASLTPELLTKLLVRWIVDIYHQMPHSGLNGETPYFAWERLQNQYGVLPPPSPDIQRHIFGLTMPRQIGNRGIHALGLFYQSKELQLIRRQVGQKRVRMRVDPTDVSRISVEGPGNTGWFNVDYVRDPSGEFDDLKGVSLAQWLEATRALKRKHADQARLTWPIVREAIRDIKAAGEEAIEAAGVESPLMSDERMEQLDRDHFRPFRIIESRAIGEGRADESLDDMLDGEGPAEEQISASIEHVPSPDQSDFGNEKDWLDG